jgi:hypothetical protein
MEMQHPLMAPWLRADGLPVHLDLRCCQQGFYSPQPASGASLQQQQQRQSAHEQRSQVAAASEGGPSATQPQVSALDRPCVCECFSAAQAHLAGMHIDYQADAALTMICARHTMALRRHSGEAACAKRQSADPLP